MKIELSAEHNDVYLAEEESVTLGFGHPWPEGAAQTLAIVLCRVAKAAAAGEVVDITFPTGVVETINAPEPEPDYGSCAECGVQFTAEEWEARHSREDGEDVHARCCREHDDGDDTVEMDAVPLTVFQVHKDEGSVVLFDCSDAEQRLVRIAVDHRPAQDLLDVLREAGEVPVIVEPWQVVARF